MALADLRDAYHSVPIDKEYSKVHLAQMERKVMTSVDLFT